MAIHDDRSPGEPSTEARAKVMDLAAKMIILRITIGSAGRPAIPRREML